jgi:hypothetical protein
MNQAIEQAIIDHTNKVWKQAHKVGMNDERQRIITLLLDADSACSEWAVALIKEDR